MFVCICNAVTDRDIKLAVADGCTTLSDLREELGVAAGCGSCADCAREILDEFLQAHWQSQMPANDIRAERRPSTQTVHWATS